MPPISARAVLDDLKHPRAVLKDALSQIALVSHDLRHPLLTLHAMRRRPGIALLSIALGLGALFVPSNNEFARKVGRHQLQHTYQLRHLSQLKGISPKKLFAEIGAINWRHPFGMVQTKNIPSKKVKICDPAKTYEEQAGCFITSDALEMHWNPDYKPGFPNQHPKFAYPNKGETMNPHDPTLIQAWKNADHVRHFRQAMAGQRSPSQITQDANSALRDINPKLNVDNTGNVMPPINQGNSGRGLPIDDTVTDPEVTIPTPPDDARTGVSTPPPETYDGVAGRPSIFSTGLPAPIERPRTQPPAIKPP